MKVSASRLLPVLRSDTVGKILAELFLTPERRVTLSDLAKAVGTSLPTAVREVDRMVDAGLLSEERIGRARRVWPNMGSPLFGPLADLIALTYGPKPVLEAALAGLDGIERAYIYGSWAARYLGEAGGPPKDVDVLVVGQPDLDELFILAEEARGKLHREVNIRSVGPVAWSKHDSDDAFLTHVRSRPLIELELEGAKP
jgi:predicted nucleotidyltransferase